MSSNIDYKTVVIAVFFSVILSTGIIMTVPQVQDALRGHQGEEGPQGIQGINGESIVGPQGAQGPQGERGEQGQPGEAGPQGEMGIQGIQGELGPIQQCNSSDFINFLKSVPTGFYYIPKIDGVAEVVEWVPFEDIRLIYQITYYHAYSSPSSAWDKETKFMKISVMMDDSNLYVCTVISDDYLSEEFQIDGVELYINGEWTAQFWWSLNNGEGGKMRARYSHTGGGQYGEDGLYTIEMTFPYDDASVNSISIRFFEVTKFTSEGLFETSTYWISPTIYDIYELEN